MLDAVPDLENCGPRADDEAPTSPRSLSSRPGDVSQKVYDYLRAKIVAGELKADQPLRQDHIARECGVSRLPVREGLKRLEGDGLAKYHPRKGYVVVSFSLEEALELFDIRIALESQALALSVPNLSRRDFDLIERHFDKFKDPVVKADCGELNREFHHLIYAACGRKRLLEMIDNVLDLSKRASEVDHYSIEAGVAEHRAIFDACVARDVDLAVKLLVDHIKESQRTLASISRST